MSTIGNGALNDPYHLPPLQVMAINALAPFIINGKLRPLMERSRPLARKAADAATDAEGPDEPSSSSSSPPPPPPPLDSFHAWPKFIVNVSAMEGKFYRFKSANHPHTNMAKAALNVRRVQCTCFLGHHHCQAFGVTRV